MGFFSDIGLSAARHLRAQLGPRGALRVLRPIIAAAVPSRARAEAIVVGIECAIEEQDVAALGALAEHWKAEHRDGRSSDIARLCDTLLGTKRATWASTLADAEVARHDGAASRSLRARTREAVGDVGGAMDDWREVVRLAPLRERAAAARVELIRLLLAQPLSRLEAARLAREMEEEPDSNAAILVLSRARLAEPGRYARVRGLDGLVALTRDPDRTIACAALHALCTHVDDSGPLLTEIERDRVEEAIRHWPVIDERVSLQATLEALTRFARSGLAERDTLLRTAYATKNGVLARAQSVVAGESSSAPPEGRDELSIALAAIAAMRAMQGSDAQGRLLELSELDIAGIPAGWTAAWMGLDREATREASLSIARKLLATNTAPPRGFLAFAAHLEWAGALELALVAIVRAEERREPGAKEKRIDAWRRAAWDAYQSGQRDEAIRCLKKAKA